MNGDQQSILKRKAAEFAVRFVMSGMRVGLGTGSTAIFATRLIGERIAAGELDAVTAIATSAAVDEEARKIGIPMIDDDIEMPLDVTIDGADEVDPQFRLIKGAGGALLREKIVAQASKRVIIVVDESKIVDRLGTKSRIPVEVLPFAWRSQFRYLDSIGGNPEIRRRNDGEFYNTDSGNLIFDCNFGAVTDVDNLTHSLAARAGIVEHGLFVGLATDVIVASESGIEHKRRA